MMWTQSIENFINNFCFGMLLCSMVFYWIYAFCDIYIFSNLGKWSVIGANCTMFFLLIGRGLYSNHFPLSNLYEALIFLSWSVTLIHLIMDYYLKSGSIIGGMTTPTALFLNGFASFQLPESMQKFSPLVPALKSNWLMMHVTVMLLSYATLICGSIVAIGYLFLHWQPKQNRGGFPGRNPLATNPSFKQLDQISFKSISIGFPLLTLGIISGSVWANEAWGSYWSWDPKETWSLITWIIFAVYLHLRLTAQNEIHSAFVATGGFFVVWICFLGVNFVAKGLHSYGWLFS